MHGLSFRTRRLKLLKPKNDWEKSLDLNCDPKKSSWKQKKKAIYNMSQEKKAAKEEESRDKI